MRPYYQHEGVSIYCGRAEEICRRLDLVFDTLVLDPPSSVDLNNWRERRAGFPSTAHTLVLLNPTNGYILLEGDAEKEVALDSKLTPAKLLWHPHARPVPRIRELLARTSGRILDPFMGSGSTLVAARELGREVVGVELEEDYCQLAEARLHWS